MNKFSPVQLILMVVAGFALVIAVIVFAFSRNSSSGLSDVQTVVWGTINQEIFNSALTTLRDSGIEDVAGVAYVEKRPESLEEDFVRALAEGEGPDLIMLRQDQIIQNENKLLVIPYESLPLRTYLDTYIPESELFAAPEGVLGIPFMIDPMVMFWNRSFFANKGISTPPRFWSEVMSIVPRLTESNSEYVVSESAIALGEMNNIDHSKEILLNLILQAGNNIVVRSNNSDSGYEVILDKRLGYTVSPALASLNFFTQFSNPSRDVYSWNRSLPSSKNQFLAGDLGMYLGFASEISEIRSKNPNLDFDVSTVPQSQSSSDRKVFGHMTALAISRNASNPSVAFSIVNILTSPESLFIFNEITGLPPVRRDMLQANPADPYQSILYTSALWSKGVLEADPIEVTEVMKFMVESFVTGRLDADAAVSRATEEIKILLDE